jgi:hypothetical protein
MYDIGYKYIDFSFHNDKNNISDLTKISGFAITIDGNCSRDYSVAEQLKISKAIYQDILIKNGARIAEDDSCIFDNEDNAIASVVALKLILGGGK